MAQFRNRFLVGLLGLLLVFTFIGCGEDEEEKDILGATKAAYVLNGTAETISVFDIETSEVQNDALSVGKWPADIKIHGDKAYVANTGDNSVQIIDLESLTDAGIIAVGEGTMPEKIGFAGDNKAYVSCNGTGAVKILDLASQQATTEIKVGTAPWGVEVVSGKLYVCNTNAAYDVSAGAMAYGDGTVSVIDTSTDQVIKTIDVETNPTEIASFQGKLAVLCTGNYADIMGKLCIIDTSSDSVINTVDLGTTPSSIGISPGGIAYITTFGGLISVDVNSGAVIHAASSPLADFGGGSGIAFDSQGIGYICVPDWLGGGNDKLLIMDASENLAGTYTLGGGASIIAVRE